MWPAIRGANTMTYRPHHHFPQHASINGCQIDLKQAVRLRGYKKCEAELKDFSKESFQTRAWVRIISFAPLNITFWNVSDEKIPCGYLHYCGKSATWTIAGAFFNQPLYIQYKYTNLINLAIACTLHQVNPLEFVFLMAAYRGNAHEFFFPSSCLPSVDLSPRC